MLCEHISIFKLNNFDNSQWITIAVVNLLLILFVQFGLPLIRGFMRESRLFDEEMGRRFREFYYAKFGPHFMARNSSPKTVIAIFIYLGVNSRLLFTCPFLSNVSLALGSLTLAMWKLDPLILVFSRLHHFVDQNGPLSPPLDKTTGMPQFQPDLMEESKRAWSVAVDSSRHHNDHTLSNSWQRIPASAKSPVDSSESSVKST